MTGDKITSVLQESRVFPPPAEFSAQANIKSEDEYNRMWNRAKDDPAGFWGEMAANLTWFRKWDKVLDGAMPNTKWFTGGKINASYNCLDRHLTDWRKNKAAIIWEGEPGDTRVLRYQDLHREVCRFANVLKKLGIKTGDRVTLYMPMIPELVIAMLGCARIGATHSIVFGGFSADAIADRNNDAKSRLVITADGGWRRGKEVPLKQTVDECLPKSSTIEKVVVVRRTGSPVTMVPDRDYWWHDLMATDVGRVRPRRTRCRASAVHPLHLRQHGKTQGRAAHDGRLSLGDDDDVAVGLRSERPRHVLVHGRRRLGDRSQLHRLRPARQRCDRRHVRRGARLARPRPLLADHRKIPGHDPLHGPDGDPRFIKWGDQWPEKYDLSSLRLLGSVGEPINPEAWMWYHRVIGQERCPIVDTWWQTETGAIMISPLPGVTADQAGQLHQAAAGNRARYRHQVGSEPAGQPGRLPRDAATLAVDVADALRRSRAVSQERISARSRAAILPATAPARRRRLLLGHGPCRRRPQRRGPSPEHDGNRSASSSHAKVAEAAVVGYPHELKGEGICCFVTLKQEDGDGGSQRRAEEPRPQANRLRRHARLRSASPAPCPKRGAAKSCDGCCATSPPAATKWATQRHSKTSRSSPNCGRRKSKRSKCVRLAPRNGHRGAGRCSRWRRSRGAFGSIRRIGRVV